MNTRNSYIFLEEQYLSVPIPQEILNERGDQLDPLITGQDADGIDIIEPRTPQNTSIGDAFAAYPALRAVNGVSPIKRYWYNGTDIPTLMQDGQNAPLDEEGNEVTGGKVFILAGIPNFTYDESNAMKDSMDALSDPATAAYLGVEPVNNSFHPWLSHKQALSFIREGVI
jgi:hypothetical protein